MKEPLLSDQNFIDDVVQVWNHPGMQLWWLGQSGYLLQYPGHLLTHRVLIDPYLSDTLTHKYAATSTPHVRMSKRVVDPGMLPPVSLITSSHNHTDHLDAQSILPALDHSPSADILIPEANRAFVAERLRLDAPRLRGMDNLEVADFRWIQVIAIPSAHPNLQKDDQGRPRYLGYVFRRPDSPTIYHSGDTLAYEGLAETPRPFKVDIAILPINGRLGNMTGREAAQLAHDIRAKLVIPCHYDMFEFNTATPDEFVAECQRLGQPYRVLQQGERLTWP